MINAASNLTINYRDVVKNDKIVSLLERMSNSASCYISMFFLPLLTTVCGLMGISEARTHREDIDFQEPNIIWSCVAAEPGMLQMLSH